MDEEHHKGPRACPTQCHGTVLPVKAEEMGIIPIFQVEKLK